MNKTSKYKITTLKIFFMLGILSMIFTLGGTAHANLLNGEHEQDDHLGNSLAVGDFDGDGYDDLAVGVFEDNFRFVDTGTVNIIHGSISGLVDSDSSFNHVVFQSLSERGDRYGSSLAVGDFDGDGVDDLAVGIPEQDVFGNYDAGKVDVIYGIYHSGLSSLTNMEWWHQGSDGIEGAVESYDRFGDSLAVGDFNGDGYDDLAIGVPDEDVSGYDNAGAVNVIYGSHYGLTSVGNQIWHQGSDGIINIALEDGDHFGTSIAVGDFNGDGYDDLAIGVPNEDIGSIDDAGLIQIIFGSDNGLTSVGNLIVHQGSDGIEGGIEGVVEKGDRYGSSLAVGDFNGDTIDDLAIGIPGEDIGSIDDAGAVSIIFGNMYTISGYNDQIWHQGSSNIEGTVEKNDHFGNAIAVGDFNNDGIDDLAIGVYEEDIGDTSDAGVVNIIFGSDNGLTSVGNQIWHQGSSHIEGVVEKGDRFGSSLATGDFNNDGIDDLVIGVPEEDLHDYDEGAINIIFGSDNGLTSVGNQMWHR